jgi:membrane fusion protein (multidrug efflux system)
MNKPLTPQDLENAAPVAASAAAATAPANPAKSPRKKLLMGLAGTVALAGAAFWTYEHVIASRHVSTDNAYVDAEVAQVTALTSGPVAEVRASDAQMVAKGDVLVVLDDRDRQLEVEQAEAAFGQVLRRVRAYGATDDALAGQMAARVADLQRARADLARAAAEYDRRKPLAGTGAISGEELTAAKSTLEAAQAATRQAEAQLKAAEGMREANNVLISGVSLDDNPEVKAARSRMEQAKVALGRTVVRAPIDGVVAKRSVQVGQMVQPGTPLMIVVPTQEAFVNANFKEVQLKKVRAGQPVELESDLYGSKVVYHGTVVGFSGGTGAAFAVVPAQNATGNWIKVVQRLPVRIALDPAELKANPLRVGLSMTAAIDISEH